MHLTDEVIGQLPRSHFPCHLCPPRMVFDLRTPSRIGNIAPRYLPVRAELRASPRPDIRKRLRPWPTSQRFEEYGTTSRRWRR